MAARYEENAAWALRLAYLLVGDRGAAEDIIQEAFIRLFSRFRDLRDPGAFPGYLRTTVVNLSRDTLRRRARESKRLLHRLPIEVQGPEASVVESDYLMRELATLPERQRVALVLRYYEDMSEDQVAASLGCSVSAAKALIHRASTSLRLRLRGDLDA